MIAKEMDTFPQSALCSHTVEIVLTVLPFMGAVMPQVKGHSVTCIEERTTSPKESPIL